MAEARGPGSLRVALLDELHGMDRAAVEAGARVSRKAA